MSPYGANFGFGEHKKVVSNFEISNIRLIILDEEFMDLLKITITQTNSALSINGE